LLLLYLEILAASFAAAAYVKQQLSPKGIAYVIAEQGVADELDLIGIRHRGMDDESKSISLAKGSYIDYDKNVEAVVVGFDPCFNYYKLQYAQLCINNISNCRFVATNLDQVSHHTDQQLWVDAGAMVGALKACTNTKPVVVGKPSNFLIDYLVKKYAIEKSRMCMIGDRLDTDIVFGKTNGMRTILTLSGVTTYEQLVELCDKEDDDSDIHELLHKPDYYMPSIADLLESK
jgi:phosphoglycolate/pyridoxal phosphate phosphatase family enzyme